jgi:hypothetical protein
MSLVLLVFKESLLYEMMRKQLGIGLFKWNRPSCLSSQMCLKFGQSVTSYVTEHLDGGSPVTSTSNRLSFMKFPKESGIYLFFHQIYSTKPWAYQLRY